MIEPTQLIQSLNIMTYDAMPTLILISSFIFVFLVIAGVFDHKGKVLKESVLNLYHNNYADSFVINFTYGFVLAIFGGGVIYYIHFVLGVSITLSLGILLAYFIVELRMMFYDDATKDPDHIASWRSLPTLGIVGSTPVVFLYILICKNKLNLFSIEGILNVWATTRYNVVNPRWLRPREDSKTIIGGSGDRNSNPSCKRAPWIYEWFNGVLH